MPKRKIILERIGNLYRTSEVASKMSKSINLQDLVKHIVNGTLEHKVCQVCLKPVQDHCQNIYSRICTEDKTYCIADVLEQVCDLKIMNTAEYKICTSCFVAATQAYKFYLTTRRSHEVLDYYVNEINNQLHSNIPQDLTSDSLCITLPMILTSTIDCDNNVNKFPQNGLQTKSAIYNLTEGSNNVVKKETKEIDTKNDDDFVIVLNENGEPEFYETQKDGTLILVDNQVSLNHYLNQLPDSNVKKLKQLSDSNFKSNHLLDSNVKKKGRRRNPMEYKRCSQCPVRYRFVSKLKEHMKEEHGIDLFVCQVCQAIIEDENEFNKHLQTHTGIHTCSICNMVFKKRQTIISHFKWHEEVKAMTQSDGAHVCEVCGLFFKDGEALKEHHDKKHVKKFTCYFCGRMYKGELSFDLHIKKHEMNNDIKQEKNKPKAEITKKRKRKFTCGTCGRDFVDERALLWHGRLHTNERPYSCDVHLKVHKRPTRASRHQNVVWKTETVPIQELSVSIQNEILELQAAQNEAKRMSKS
ncbi:jg8131 [Pararge aegeria aegeria]|uniref:Jg8131 protein n=1 Tax=Pararge aegeria aegeria TaxID=348720 RepID=A0A8S4RZ91_9NEOP|nr:jg8131 [Pararge aegeria aegeria]